MSKILGYKRPESRPKRIIRKVKRKRYCKKLKGPHILRTTNVEPRKWQGRYDPINTYTVFITKECVACKHKETLIEKWDAESV